ncbi:unnamed protein product, partial [Phaeothamnion confervicola]
KQVLLVVNKVDILATAVEAAEVEAFVRQNATALLGAVPPLFPVSARLALQAKLAARPSPDPATGAGAGMWQKSGFAELERHIQELLKTEERVRSKLLSPLGVAERVVDDALETCRRRAQVRK